MLSKLLQIIQSFCKFAYFSENSLNHAKIVVDDIIWKLSTVEDIINPNTWDVNEPGFSHALNEEIIKIFIKVLEQLSDLLYTLTFENAAAKTPEVNFDYQIYVQHFTNPKDIIRHVSKIKDMTDKISSNFKHMSNIIDDIYQEESPEQSLSQFVEKIINLITGIQNICIHLGLELNISDFVSQLNIDRNWLMDEFYKSSKSKRKEELEEQLQYEINTEGDDTTIEALREELNKFAYFKGKNLQDIDDNFVDIKIDLSNFEFRLKTFINEVNELNKKYGDDNLDIDKSLEYMDVRVDLNIRFNNFLNYICDNLRSILFFMQFEKTALKIPDFSTNTYKIYDKDIIEFNRIINHATFIINWAKQLNQEITSSGIIQTINDLYQEENIEESMEIFEKIMFSIFQFIENTASQLGIDFKASGFYNAFEQDKEEILSRYQPTKSMKKENLERMLEEEIETEGDDTTIEALKEEIEKLAFNKSAKINVNEVKSGYKFLVGFVARIIKVSNDILGLNSLTGLIVDYNKRFIINLNGILNSINQILFNIDFNKINDIIESNKINENYLFFRDENLSPFRIVKIAKIISNLTNNIKSYLQSHDLVYLAEKIELEEGDMIRYYEEVAEIIDYVLRYIKDVATWLVLDFNYGEISSALDEDLGVLKEQWKEPERELSEEELEEMMEGMNEI